MIPLPQPRAPRRRRIRYRDMELTIQRHLTALPASWTPTDAPCPATCPICRDDGPDHQLGLCEAVARWVLAGDGATRDEGLVEAMVAELDEAIEGGGDD